jgi:hypothetical protein
MTGRARTRCSAGPGADFLGGVGSRSPGNDLFFLGRGHDAVTDGLGNDVYHGEGTESDEYTFGF